MSLRHPVACLLFSIAATIAAPAWALETRCVDSVDELDAALTIAIDDPVEIHLVRGSYDIDATPLHCFGSVGCPDPDDDITIIGGYAPGCGSRTLEPFTTVLTNGPGGGISIWGHGDSGDVTFESVTLENMQVSINLGDAISGGYEARFSRVAFVRSALWTVTDLVTLSQSLFLDASAVDDGYFNGCAAVVTPPARVNITHSVFTGNAGKGFCIDDGPIGSGWELFATSNIFWNNGGADIYTRSTDDESDVHLVNNIIQTTSIEPAAAEAPVGSVDEDPLFVNAGDDYGVFSNYHLQVGSPAINSGWPDALGLTHDMDGGPRWIGSRPDRGAYESNVDDTNGLTVTTATDQIAPLIAGSLRWAILQSNADPDTNTIRFNIAGGCPRIIELLAPLPSITDRVVIDGYSQPGSEEATSSLSFNAAICIGIKGDLSTDHALELPISVGAGESLNVSGIGFGGFDVGAIRIAGGAGSWIHGNQFGGELDGVALGNSAVNVRIGGTSYNNLVGGEEPAQRNLIMSAWNAGIELLANSGGTDGYENFVTNNFIGTNASGTAMAANNLGIRVRTRENVIEDNLISGNQTHGVLIDGALANDNTVRSNRIGLKSFAICLPEPCDPDYALGNIQFGVLVDGGSGNRIDFNEVAHNGSKGVRLFEGQRNRLLGNSVHDNASFGIDLGVEGVNPVYPAGGSDQLANFGINAPTIAGARGGPHAGRLTGLVSARGATSYVMQAFSSRACDASGYGEGQTLVGTKIIAIGGSPGSGGTVEYEMPVESNASLQPRFITTTWFDEDGNSSEFSNCVPYQCDTIFRHGFDSASADRCTAP